LFQEILGEGDDYFFRPGARSADVRRRWCDPILFHIIQNVWIHHRSKHVVHHSRLIPTGRFRGVVPVGRQGRTEDSAVDLVRGDYSMSRPLGCLLQPYRKR